MKSVIDITERFFNLNEHEEIAPEDTESSHILYKISDEILSELGEIENYDDVKKSLVTMFLAGFSSAIKVLKNTYK